MISKLSCPLCLLSTLLLAALCSCSGVAQENPTLEPSEIPTHTTIPDTPVPQPTETPVEVIYEITFDGANCTVPGLDEVTPGYHKFAFDNQGDRNFGPWAAQFLDGKTYQDFLDEVHLGPKEPHPKPDWVKYPFYSTRDYKVWSIGLKEPGEYGLFVGSYTPWQEYPCGSFRVVESPSE